METKEEYKTPAAEEEIDLSGLARLMLIWEQKKREIDELEQGIKDAVLALRQTQTVGYARAAYSNPRKSYDYKGPGQFVDELTVAEHSKYVTDWRAVCKAAKIEPIVTSGTGPGSVSLKLLK